jgi:hypothetical protein
MQRLSALSVHFQENNMTNLNDAGASSSAYEPKVLAKKYRISLEDAQNIIAQYGPDRKAADKAARRIAA